MDQAKTNNSRWNLKKMENHVSVIFIFLFSYIYIYHLFFDSNMLTSLEYFNVKGSLWILHMKTRYAIVFTP